MQAQVRQKIVFPRDGALANGTRVQRARRMNSDVLLERCLTWEGLRADSALERFLAGVQAQMIHKVLTT